MTRTRKHAIWTGASALALFLAGCEAPETGHDAPPPAPTPAANGDADSATNGDDTPLLARFDWFHYEGGDPAHEAFPAGEGEFQNPVLGGFYPDPNILQVGGDYYLTTSTFAYFPGLPVFHSRDLVNWTQIGNALDRPGMVDFGDLGLSRGIFAPAMAHHEGVFYMLNTCVDCGDNFLITAQDPAGPWSDPVWLPDLAGGIDPSLFIDEDGRAYILNNGPPDREPEYDGHRAVWIQQFDMETLSTFGERIVLVDGGVDFSEQPIWIEGPHIYKVDGLYYLICAEGGTAEGHSQVVLRSENPMGPYEAWEGNPILTQRDLPRDRPHPITSAGHASFVTTPSGEWWGTFLAVRPYGDDMYNTGRETFLMPVSWEEGWPRMTGDGDLIPYAHPRPDLPPQEPSDPPMAGAFEVHESFDGPLPPHWMMLRLPEDNWYDLETEPGSLTLTARAVGLGENANPSYLGRRQQHMYASASMRMRFEPQDAGDRAGLVALQSDEYWYFIGLARDGEGDVIRVERRAGPEQNVHGEILASTPFEGQAGAPLDLRITARAGEYDFHYALADGEWRPLLGDADGTLLSTRIAGGFVGVTMGPYAYRAAE
ncbi:MAG: glycoside hydrolase family 43 protein [Oceanicaulis sp.]|nr:glycoside hydrolase family 43 protein [Oceanicaulis sp.]